MKNSGQPERENWLRLDELTNAIDNLEMCVRFLRELPEPIRWKWAIIAMHQAIYGFAIRAVKGTDDLSVLRPAKPGKEPMLITFWEALKRANDRRFVWPGATPLNRSQEEEWALEKLSSEFRNGFEHFQPAGWSIEVSGMPRIFRIVSGLCRRLTLDNELIRYYETVDRERISKALTTLNSALAALG